MKIQNTGIWVDGIDESHIDMAEYYYFEKGNVVFTAAYHRKRGYCCGSGCRHCPFKQKERQDQDPRP